MVTCGPSSIFTQYVVNGTIFGKNVAEDKMSVLLYSANFI
jgi:hypothetical protein